VSPWHVQVDETMATVSQADRHAGAAVLALPPLHLKVGYAVAANSLRREAGTLSARPEGGGA
jgi:hypothetical protein